MKVKLRHKLTFAFIVPIASIVFFFKYGYRYKVFTKRLQNLNGVKPPFFILANHVALLDCFFVAIAIKQPIYFIASDNIFSTPILSGIMKFLVSPIPKLKGTSDIQTVKDSISLAKQGGSIGLFPSGNTTYSGTEAHINDSAAKLAKLLKIDVLLFRTQGVFGVAPRWKRGLRKGKCFGEVVEVIKKDDLKTMNVSQIYDKITTSLISPTATECVLSKYKSKHRAEYLERFLFWCPSCNKFHTLISKNEFIYCTYCGAKIEYGLELDLKLIKGKIVPASLNEWNKMQISALDKCFSKLQSGIIFNDKQEKLIFNQRATKHTTLLKSANLKLYKNKFVVESEEKQFVFMLENISSVAIQNRNKLIFYHNGESFQIAATKTTNHFKYMVYYYLWKKNKLGEDLNGILGL